VAAYGGWTRDSKTSYSGLLGAAQYHQSAALAERVFGTLGRTPRRVAPASLLSELTA